MDIQRYKESIKRRRMERLQLLRNKQRSHERPHIQTARSTPRSSDMWSSHMPVKETVNYGNREEVRTDQPRIFSAWRWIGAICLVLAVYGLYETDNPSWQLAQTYVQHAFTDDTAVRQVVTWYEHTVGEGPALLPSLLPNPVNEEQVPPNDYVFPVHAGRVLAEFGQIEDGIVVGTDQSGEVEAVKEGSVVAIKEEEGLGLTVIIQHNHNEESWYGHLQDVHVQLHDWVQQGETIGLTTEHVENGQGVFYFAVKKDDHFIDPLDVIQFD